MVKRWLVPKIVGRIQSGVTVVEVVAASDYDDMRQVLRDAETHLVAGSPHDALLTIRAALKRE